MKFFPALLLFAFSILNFADETEPVFLWPDGKTPYLKKDDEAARPKIFIYAAPEKTRNGAAVVVCPGGGYGGLATDHEGNQIGQFFQELGVTAFVLHYRLGPQGYHFPTQLADVQRAIRFARSEAKTYDLDTDRIGVMGFSAGGHLASMASTKFNEKAYEPSDDIDNQKARPNFSVLAYPVISMSTEHGHGGSRRNLLGKDAALDSDEARHVSSELNVTAETPPTFIFQTNEDKPVPAENCVLYYLALRKHNVPAEMHIYQPGPHGVGLFHGDPVISTWAGHLQAWLRDSGFLAAGVTRTPVKGEATLDGKPVSWGSVTFKPDDPNLPVTTLRIRNGKFSGEAATTAGKVSFAGSIWEQTRDPKDRVVKLDSLSPGSEKLTFDFSAEVEPLSFDFRSR